MTVGPWNINQLAKSITRFNIAALLENPTSVELTGLRLFNLQKWGEIIARFFRSSLEPSSDTLHHLAGQYCLQIKFPIFSYHTWFWILIDFFKLQKTKELFQTCCFYFKQISLLEIKWKPSFNQTKPFWNKVLIKQGWILQFGINTVPAQLSPNFAYKK